MTRMRLASAVLLAAALAFASAANAKPYVTRWFPFELRNGHIHVPIEVAGVATTAMFDTGASVHMLDREFAQSNGIAFSAAGALEIQAGHSRERVPVARGVPIELFGARTKLKTVAISPVPFAKIVIGTGILSSFVMQIDYVNERIRFASFDAVRMKETANVELRKSGFNGLPAGRATLDGEEVWLLFDTGFSGPLILNPSFLRGRDWPEDAGALSVDALGTVRGMRRYAVPLLQLGPYDLRGVSAHVPAEGRLPSALTSSGDGGVRVRGVLGAEVLRHFLVTIDVKHTLVHLGPALKDETESWESSVSTDDPPLPEPETPPGS